MADSDTIARAIDRAVQVIDACWYAENLDGLDSETRWRFTSMKLDAKRLRADLVKRLDAARAEEASRG